jgi:hypothetical protein
MKQLTGLLIFICLSGSLQAQLESTISSKDSLFNTIQTMDSIFFHAFNTFDTSKSKSLFAKDLEFYHDRGGLTNYEQNLNSIRYRCNSKAKVRRELVAGSLEVYPIANYGAIEIGIHNFYYTEPGKTEQLDGSFRFLHIWIYRNNDWKISRVVSYDH